MALTGEEKLWIIVSESWPAFKTSVIFGFKKEKNMTDNLNKQLQKVIADNRNNNNKKKEPDFEGSTFAQVHASKTAPVQMHLDQQLASIIGSSFLLVEVDEQKNVDQSSGEVKIDSIYTVRVISRKAKAFRKLVQIKVKNAKPIIETDELDKLIQGNVEPIILRFENIAHYAFMGGESLNATSVERLKVSVEEAMNHE